MTDNCTVEHINNGHFEETVLRQGDVLQWHCDINGYAKYPGERETVCDNGTLTPPPECRLSKYINNIVKK